MKRKVPNLKVTQDPEKPVAPEVIATSIRDIAEGTRRLMASELNERAVLILLAHSSGIRQSDIQRVLNAMQALDKTYLRKKG